jgi:hypothetical protein
MAALTITLHGTDGSVFNYYAVDDEHLGPGEMGWILIVENSPTPIAPQRVSAAEVYGDLVSMTLDPQEAREMVQAGTEKMRDLARERASTAAAADAKAWGKCANAMAAELEELARL